MTNYDPNVCQWKSHSTEHTNWPRLQLCICRWLATLPLQSFCFRFVFIISYPYAANKYIHTHTRAHIRKSRPKVESTEPTIYMLKLQYNFQRSYILFITIICGNLMLCLCACITFEMDVAFPIFVLFIWSLAFHFHNVVVSSWVRLQAHSTLYECNCDKIKSHILTDSPHVCVSTIWCSFASSKILKQKFCTRFAFIT